MQGLHLTADLFDCQCDMAWLVDEARLGERCVQAVQRAHLQPVGRLFHRFPDSAHGPGGVTATVLLAESHVCVHTWPERSQVTLDVYVATFWVDHPAQAHALLQPLLPQAGPDDALQRHQLGRRIVDDEDLVDRHRCSLAEAGALQAAVPPRRYSSTARSSCSFVKGLVR